MRPKDAKSWFSIPLGEDGKIAYVEALKDGEKASEQPAKAMVVTAAVA